METLAAGSHAKRAGQPRLRRTCPKRRPRTATTTVVRAAGTNNVRGIHPDVELEGTRIGQYQVVELIGTGGSGKVYRARDTRDPRCVAIKVLRTDSPIARGLQAEAAALARLTHPHVSTFYELITQQGRDFIVMEFVPGATLRDVMKGGPLPTSEVLRLGAQMMRGLAAAHDARVVHRDVKPANLKVTSSGELKILDFGLAKVMPDSETAQLSADTGRLEIVGTAPYMAPERLLGDPSDHRADIFSAGAVLYEMATGQRAFPSSYLPELVTKILFERVQAPTSVHPLVPDALSRLVVKMLEKDACARPQRASLVADQLEALYRRYVATTSVPAAQPLAG